MAENLCTWHELIIKAYDEVWWELLYSWGFITEPNDTVEDFLLENNITLSNAATAEVECDMTGDLWTITWTWKTQTFYEILSSISLSWRCDLEWEDVEWDATEVPATLVMSVYGVLNKENNQHGAIFTWHSVPYDDYSAMRGPCPEGFHVPSATEWQWVNTIMTSLSLTTWDSWRINLHMPFAGYRTYRDVSLGSQGSYGRYLSSSPYSNSTDNISTLMMNSSSVNANTSFYRTHGYSMRCFKDSYVSPDSNWTVVQWTLWSAWIFWNQSQWLISITDWTTGYTMMDKNLWATTVYNDWDTLTQQNMWNMYQWWNNYGFPSTWTITNTSSTKVDASSYWPNTDNWYYSSDTFIFWNANDWSSVRNNDLWGWVTWVISWYKLLHKEFYLDYSAMRGPCPEGYHIPLNTERQAVYNIWTALWWWASAWNDFLNALKMPKIWHLINQNGTVVDRDNYWDYRSSTPSYTTTVNNASFYMHAYNNNSINPQDSLVRPNGMCLRAFKDEPVVPNSTRTMLYWTGLASWWIFWNQTAWLISMSSDWATWITIRDKNEWATSVYNNWDTKTAANCWWYYQRWNNHLFPFGSGVTTGTELVDTTWYWPGNYYSGATFIVTNASPNDWSSTRNDNLRWWVTWAVERGRRVI